jgi:hypothetical protein
LTRTRQTFRPVQLAQIAIERAERFVARLLTSGNRKSPPLDETEILKRRGNDVRVLSRQLSVIEQEFDRGCNVRSGAVVHRNIRAVFSGRRFLPRTTVMLSYCLQTKRREIRL